MQPPVNHKCHGLIQRALFAVFILFPRFTIAQSADTPPAIVVVSMVEQSSALYWLDGEERILDELRMSQMKVTTVVGSPYASLNIRAELRRAAQKNKTKASLLIYKTDFENARLVVYTRQGPKEVENYSETNFSLSTLSTSRDATEIVALKTAEVVSATLVGAAQNDTRQPLRTSSSPPRPHLPKQLKIALTLAITGAGTLGLGGVFLWRREVHVNEANSISDKMYDKNDLRLFTDMEELRPDFQREKDSSTAYRVAAVVACSLGGALLTASIIMLSYHRKKSRETTDPIALTFQGANFILEF